jgi:cytoskeletal protein CcmA (bactofilin family)
MFGKSNKPSPIDSLIGAGTTIEGDITFVGGLRIDGHVKGNVKATRLKARSTWPTSW